MEKRTVSEIFTLTPEHETDDLRPRLVLDTNTVLALWMFRDPTLDTLRKWIEAGNALLHSREDALEELRQVLAYRQFGLDAAMQCALLREYRARLDARAPKAPPTATPLPTCRDPDDQKFLEIAAQAAPSYLVTRDKALQRLARHRLVRYRISVLTPERFAAALAGEAPPGE